MAAYGKKKLPLWVRIVVSVFFSLLAAGVLYFGLKLMTLTDIYHADDSFGEYELFDEVDITKIADSWDVRKGSLIAPDGWYYDGPGEETALIFYPGERVESKSYEPLMHDLADAGVDCFLVNVPISIPLLYKDVAGYIMAAHDEYTNWYIVGHDQGGETAADFCSEHLTEVTGLILLASYPTTSLKYGGFKVLSIFGTQDTVIDSTRFIEGRSYMPANYREVAINGGNHSYFGRYGLQENDSEASITQEEQEKQTKEAILEFIQGQ